MRSCKPPFKRNHPPSYNANTPPEKIHIEEFAQDHYCHANETSHSERNCPTFINMFKVFVSMERDERGQTCEDEKRNDQNIESSINVLWDGTCGIIHSDDEKERSEEICISQTRSKGIPSTPEAIVTPSPCKKSVLQTR